MKYTVSNTASGTPIRNGIGAHRISFILSGKIGMKMCCQTMGYKNACAACTLLDNRSKRFDVKTIRRSANMAANTAIIFFGSAKL